MPERNLCIDSGCHGYCCQDIDLEITKPALMELFPDAIKVSSIRALAELKLNQKPGQFYITGYESDELKGPGFCLLTINGPCPNRDPKGSCIVHEKREHAAINFKIGSSDCNAIRKEHGLGPIFLKPSAY